jgi:chemotaxis family two-component system response regulator PixG
MLTTTTVFKNLINEFKACTEEKYSGKLEVKSQSGYSWNFYYRFGRIIWASGGNYPWRRWRRYVTQYCSQITIDEVQLRPLDSAIEYWDYNFFTNLYKQNKIDSKQIDTIAENIIAELLFDLAQKTNSTSVTWQRDNEILLKEPINFTSTSTFLNRVHTDWYIWVNSDLANFCPDLAPMLCQPELIKHKMSQAMYEKFVILMNGEYTLREIAVKIKQDVLTVASLLLPYILRGIIKLVEVSDLPLLTNEYKNINCSIPTKITESNTPLIACIDDSPQVCRSLEYIIRANGMRFLKIQNPIEAIPILLEHKPDLIFLDLLMPVINGYELCTQIRRISEFTNTPVVILTGSDGLFDRVRAKVVGSTDFVTKPVTVDIMAVVHKYLDMKLVKNKNNLPPANTLYRQRSSLLSKS